MLWDTKTGGKGTPETFAMQADGNVHTRIVTCSEKQCEYFYIHMHICIYRLSCTALVMSCGGTRIRVDTVALLIGWWLKTMAMSWRMMGPTPRFGRAPQVESANQRCS